MAAVAERLDRAARSRGAWAAVIAIALVARLAFLATAPPVILWQDGRVYEEIGWRLVAEHRYTGSYLTSPGYPFFIAGIYGLAGRHLFALRLVQMLLSTAAVAAAGAAGAALLSPAAGLLAALLLALHPVVAFLPVTQYAEDLLVLESVLFFGAFALALRRPTAPRFAGLGVWFGLFMLTKSVAAMFAPGLALGAWIELRGARRLALAAWFALALLLTLLPWTWRNWREYHRVIPVSAGAQQFLWMANNDLVTGWEGGPSALPAWLADSLASRPDPFERDRFYGQLARQFVTEHPGRAFQLYLTRMLNLWSPYPRTVTPTPYRNPAADLAQGGFSLALFTGVALGLAGFVRRRRFALLLAALSYTLLAPIFITVLRYRMSMEPILIWIAAAGFWQWLERGRGGRSAAPLDRAHPAEVGAEPQ